MKPLTDLEREELVHLYDPVKAHEYYIRTRHLKGRHPGAVKEAPIQNPKKAKAKAVANAREKQRHELTAAISNLQSKLNKLEALIRQREQEAAASNHKSKARKERAAKEHTKPKTAAEKAKIKRENKKYRDQHKQTLRAKAKQHHTKSGKSGGVGGPGGVPGVSTPAHKHSLSELKSLATKVRGQIQVAKQKLAAL